MKEFWRKKLPSFLLAVLMVATMVPTAGAATRSDMEISVDAGDEVTLSRSDFKNLFEDESNETLEYVEFTDADDLDDYGYFTAYDYYDDECDLDADDLEAQAYFYYYDSDVPKSVDYALTGLTFVADDDADDGSFVMDFVMVGDDGDEVSGTLEITVDGDGRSGRGSADVTYEVDSGERVTFDVSDFAALKSFEYLLFTDYSDLDSYGYFTAYDKDDDKVSLDESDLDNLWFYYDEDDIDHDSDCDLDTLTFVADDDADGVLSLDFELYNSSGSKRHSGTLEIEIGDGKSSSSSSKADGDIVYSVEENDDITFDKDDFKDFFEDTYNNFDYIRFTDISNLDECGILTTFTYDDRSNDWDTVELDEDEALDGYFYYDDDDVEDAADTYCLDGLGFEADNNTDGEVVTLDFTAYGARTSNKVYGTLVIEIGDVKNSSSSKSDIEYEAAPKEEVVFDEEDFNDFFQESYSSYDFKYLYFTNSKNLGTYNGSMYYKHGRSSEVRFSASSLKNAYFYYDEDDIPEDDDDCYPLEDLSFVASEYFDTAVTLDFTAYYSSSRQVSGTVTISPDGDKKDTVDTPQASGVTSSILYTTTYGTSVQLKANDFARFYESKIAGSTFQSVKLLGVPSAGGLYYNYYNASPYGTSARLQLTAYNCGNQPLYASPANTTQYALTELTYVPSGTNYCASIPFAASGTGGYTVYGSVMISVTTKAIPEVYGLTPKNTAVSFPAPAISSAVSTGTSATLAGIQLLALPASTAGSVYVGTGTARKANTSDLYSVSGGSWTISQLRFVPTTGYTGNVEIPYAAYNTAGKVVGVGKFSLGVVNNQAKFSDVTSSSWCYKYVAELSDAGVISGYSNGTFKPNNTISYGAALKLIMLAAGYPEQAPTVSGSTFSGYLSKAQADGLVTRTNVNLSAPITRLQVAQLASGALKLNLNNLSSVKPFTDTTDKHVQALNAAGIVEGYFSGGTSTYKPNNTLTRGQVSAIVWRMQNYK